MHTGTCFSMLCPQRDKETPPGVSHSPQMGISPWLRPAARAGQLTPFSPGSAAALKRTYSSAASAPSGNSGAAPFAADTSRRPWAAAPPAATPFCVAR
jgi:hypothetical protein